MKRKRIVLHGVVQGVGFRPHIYRLAMRFDIRGTVQNTPEGVVIEAEGGRVDSFIGQLDQNLPPLSRIDAMEVTEVAPQGSSAFTIIESSHGGPSGTPISPDVAVCDNCRRELGDASDRRYAYPFINCTDCGPRFSIIRNMPYDRPFTTMSIFTMCPSCRREYENPADRRYHAQPISCFDCGPRLVLEDRESHSYQDPIKEAALRLLEGKVLAIKGIGGYHLACLARSDEAVLRLRGNKSRETKPFALMGTLEMIGMECELTDAARVWLQSPAAPIVLLPKQGRISVSAEVARGQNRLGFMLPYTPLHLLLIEEVKQPLVMTSANLAEEPIVYQDEEKEGLFRLADFILWHDRPIEALADDSVVQVQEGHTQIIRRSRGFVPDHVELATTSPVTVLGLGAMLKGTFAFLKGNRAWVSQYISTLESPQSLKAEKRFIDHFMRFFSLEPEVVAHDLHPLYPNRILADEFPCCRRVEVQHHRAHVAALLAENREEESIIGVAMDGTGYGDDGAIWGGEFFTGGFGGMERAGNLQYLFLPGGDAAAKEPWRFALSILYALYGEGKGTEVFARKFGDRGKAQLEAIVKKMAGVNTSSCGRLFDAAAALLGIGNRNTYDGELPSLLQALAENAADRTKAYSFSLRRKDDRFLLDMLPAFAEMLADRSSTADRAAAFHRALTGGIVQLSELLRYQTGINKVGLSGGVFQNLFLLEDLVRMLEKKQFQVLLHRHFPCNDGSISLGQAVLASRMTSGESSRG